MNPSEITGMAFVLGILSIGVSYGIYNMKTLISMSQEVSSLKQQIKSLCDQIQSLREDRDKFHPRKQ